jgi:uncharacterized protein DUF4332
MSEPVELRAMPGMPPPALHRLRRLTITSSSDLLRINVAQVERKLRGTATAADLYRWRSIAALLEIDGLPLDAAAALVAGGITSTSELGRTKISGLRTLLAAARTAGSIAAMPDDDTLAKWMVDGVQLAATGVLNVTVVAKAGGKALDKAVATAGSTSGTTDEHGRVRLLRLPIGEKLALHVEHRGSAPATVDATPHSTRVLEGTRVELAKGSSGKKKAKTAKQAKKTKHLSEFAGDVLPERNGQPLHLETETGSRLRSGDRLRWFETLKGGDAKLVTSFLEYDGTRWFARVWRLPRARLPAAANEGDSFRVVRGALVAASGSSMAVARARVVRRLLKGVKRKSGRAAADRQLVSLVKRYLTQTAWLRGS